jgi:hypothetical protein
VIGPTFGNDDQRRSEMSLPLTVTATAVRPALTGVAIR